MRLGRGPREVYRVYGEDEAPDVDEWSGEATRELAVECPPPEGPTREFDMDSRQPDAPTRELDPEATPRTSNEPHHTRRPYARLDQLRRVAVMALLGIGVGLVAALALHSLRGPAGINGGRAGWAGSGRSRSFGQGAASLSSSSPSVSVAAVPASAHKPRTVRAFPVHAAVGAPRGHSKAQGESGVQRESARDREHGAGGGSPTRQAASAAHTAAYSTAAPPSQGTAEAPPLAAAAESEFTFER